MSIKNKTRKAPWTDFAGKAGLSPNGQDSSDKAKRVRRFYLKRKREFLARRATIFCPVVPQLKIRDLHHTAGRAGTLLIDERFWLGVSRKGHDWIHANPERARACGLLCGPGKWNRPPRDAETRRLRKVIEAL